MVESWCPNPPLPTPVQQRRQLPGCLDHSALKHIGMRRLYMTGMLRNRLVQKFSDIHNIEDPALRDPSHPAIWRKTLDTGILIESVSRWRGELVQKTPAILIKPGSMQNQRVMLSDVSGMDRRTFKNYTTIWAGSHTIFCVHSSGAAAEILAAETQRELTEFSTIIAAELGLNKFQVLEVGELGIVEEAMQNFVVPITIGWAFQEQWQIKPLSLPLTGVNIETNK